MNDDILNHILTFLPTKELRNWRLSADTFTALIERDFPLTVSKNPCERYLGLLNTDIISKGQMAIALMHTYAPESVGKIKVITASAAKAIMKRQTTRANWSDKVYTEYAHDERTQGDIAIEYLRGNIILDEPSLIVTKDSYKIFPFSYDRVYDVVMGLREIAYILGTDGNISTPMLSLIVSYPNVTAMEGIKIKDINLDDYSPSEELDNRMRYALECESIVSKFALSLHP